MISDISPIGEKKWKRATEKYEKILEPIYEKISLILKSKLHKHLDNPKEIIQIFLQFETILKSADIMELLAAERQHFLQSLHGHVKQLKENLAEPKVCPDDSEISAVCWETRELKSFQMQVCGELSHLLVSLKFIDSQLFTTSQLPVCTEFNANRATFRM